MKKPFKFLGYGILTIFLLFLLLGIGFFIHKKISSSNNMKLLGQEAAIITKDGVRDLNKNGKLDPYENPTTLLERRVNDLVSQMTLEEKAGAMFITMILMNPDGSIHEMPNFKDPMSFIFETNSTMVAKKKMNHFNILQAPTGMSIAKWNNNIQKMGERTRLGIPITIATDPRHVATDKPGANIPTPFFSQWCSSLGFAAIGDTILMREFGEAARREYTALGIRLALSPMADLGTEPRWGRFNGTFGEDANLSAQMTKAYVLGFQGDSLGKESVACMTKHFSGAGPQKDGEDAHFPYGKDQVYPGNNFDYHLIPFEQGAFAANTAQIMPYYGVPVGQTSEDVGFAYNKEIITGLLRDKYAFDGVVCTDWGLITPNPVKPPAAYGVEDLSELERTARIIEAGCDMFGGESCVDLVIELVKSGSISEERIDLSVKRIMRDKFRLGLFDNPYVDETNLAIVGNDDFVGLGIQSQKRSLVLLKNTGEILPLRKGSKVYVQDFDETIVEDYATVVADVEEAEVILLKLKTPFTPRNEYLLESYFHQGRLHYTEEEKTKLLELINSKPTVTVMTMERPTVFPAIDARSKAVIADFDSSDDAILGLIFGEFAPTGKLPFEIPSSVEAVENQKEDVPYDSADPLYPFGAGMTHY